MTGSKTAGAVDLVLASGSESRARLMRNAGLSFRIRVESQAEDQAKARLDTDGITSPARRARVLAEAKARAVSLLESDALVIGADQVVDLDGHCLEKPATVDAARDQLRSLRGKTHGLETAVTVFRGGRRVWTYVDRPEVTVRWFSEAFLETYLDRPDRHFLTCAGCYQIESFGVQLFETLKGDFFSVQGLPLIPLLAALRDLGVIDV